MDNTEKMMDIIRGENLDGIIVTDKYNMRYLSNFKGEGMLLVTFENKYLLTDSRYTEAAQKESPDFVCIDIGTMGFIDTLKKVLPKTGVHIGFENDSISYRQFYDFVKELTSVSFVPLNSTLDELRMIKTEEEIELIGMAEHIGDEAFTKIKEYIKEGVTEKDIALELEYYMKKGGADGLSFDTIAASGMNSSMPHAIPSEKEVMSGEFITMDFGCTFEGYCSDMTRTVALGHSSNKMEEIYDIVLTAQTKAIEAIKPGITCNSVDKIARDYIRDKGYGNYFGHGLGHSVGLFIHEEPRFSPKCSCILKPGMVITVEPGIYLPGQFGVRIEDVIAVTENGCRNLTKSHKKYTVL